MANIVDERGYNQIFRRSTAQSIRLHRRAEAISAEMSLPVADEIRRRIRILEIGCGTGELAHYLAEHTGAHVTGVDLSAQFIDTARATYEHETLNFVVGNISQMFPRVEGDKYDYIVGNGILHHLYHDLDSFLPVLRGWLAPRGRLIFWEPNLMNPYVYLIFSVPVFRRWAKLEPDEMAFTPRFIRRKLRQAGFDRIRITTRDFLLPNTPEVLIRPTIAIGSLLEKIPLVRSVAQSIFLSAQTNRGE